MALLGYPRVFIPNRLLLSHSRCSNQSQLVSGPRHICCSPALSRKGPSKLKGRKPAAQQWILRQQKDPYVKLAQQDNYRCRSAFKLLEIDDKHKILKHGGVVVDCGAAPGSWTQVAVCLVAAKKGAGQVIAIDLQPMAPIEGATLLQQHDFLETSTQQEILLLLAGRSVDVVLSDMAPSASGVKSLDHDKIIDLCLGALKFCMSILGQGGTFLCKIWQGGRQAELQTVMERLFGSVRVIRPHASRMDSAEIYLLGKNFNRSAQR